MGNLYENERILLQVAARLIPPTPFYPDCECVVVITENHLYVVEDNFDGTCQNHFKILYQNVSSIDAYIPEPPDGKARGGGMSTGQYAASAILALLGGMILIPGKATQARMGSEKLLKIEYQNEMGGTGFICFSHCPAMKKMIRFYKKHRIKA